MILEPISKSNYISIPTTGSSPNNDCKLQYFLQYIFIQIYIVFKILTIEYIVMLLLSIIIFEVLVGTWSVESTKFLISLRQNYNLQFESAKKKGKKMQIWELISNDMKEKGYALTPTLCDEKWRRLLTQYRKHYDARKKSGNYAVKWQYFELMSNAITSSKKQAISPPKGLITFYYTT